MSLVLVIALLLIVPVIAVIRHYQLPKCTWCQSRNTEKYRLHLKIRWCKNCHHHFACEEK